MVKDCFFLQEGAEKMAVFVWHAVHGAGSLDDALLSDQEIELVKHCCSTDTYAQIGEKMHFSARTISDHVEVICRKLGVKNRIALAMYALNTGLVHL